MALSAAANDLPQYEWRSCNTGSYTPANAQAMHQSALGLSSSRYSSNVQSGGEAGNPYASAPLRASRPGGGTGGTIIDTDIERPGIDQPLGDIPFAFLLLLASAYAACILRRNRKKAFVK